MLKPTMKEAVLIQNLPKTVREKVKYWFSIIKHSRTYFLVTNGFEYKFWFVNVHGVYSVILKPSDFNSVKDYKLVLNQIMRGVLNYNLRWTNLTIVLTDEQKKNFVPDEDIIDENKLFVIE